MGCRCFWDSDTDAYAEDTYRNVRTPHRAATPRLARAPSIHAASLTAAPYARRIRSSASPRRLARTCTERVSPMVFARRRSVHVRAYASHHEHL